MDWNWDTTWWRKPKRVVRPTGPREQPRDDQSPPPSAASPDQRQGADRQPGQAATPEDARSRPQGAGVAREEDAAASEPVRGQRPFYQLYLSGGADPRPAGHRGDHLQKLRHAGARPCSRLLEMLYVPLGCSGSPDECYLIYENRAEFDAAVGMAPSLDLTPLDTAPSTVTPEGSFQVGLGLYLRIVEQGAIVNRGSVDECEQHLAEATQSGRVPPRTRWAAGVLAGRLVSEYRYDYATARSYYRQAERAAAPGSLEQMTARWWYADALAQEGKAKDAEAAYRAILKAYDDKWKDSHIVRRARAIIEQRRE